VSAGPDFYDDASVFAAYRATRSASDDLNAHVEAPLVEALVADVRGEDVVELGCGDGGYGVDLLRCGARSYTGLEGSRLMCAAARQRLAALDGWRLEERWLEEWQSEPASADVVVSRMALHYVQDLPPVLKQAYRCLRPGGRLVLSVEHPVVTSHYATNLSGSIPDRWTVTDYFVSGARSSSWLGAEVAKYHRTIEEWTRSLGEAGFAVTALREGDPRGTAGRGGREALALRRLVPMYLVLAAEPLT